jgi:hypothetical protein
MILSPDCTTSIKASVTATAAAFSSSMAARDIWLFMSTTNCWIKQANPSGTITCVAKASMADTDIMTINDGTTTVTYEFDTAGNGVTGGRVQVNISGATTAAQVAAILKTAINANQSYITVTDNLDGTLSLSATTKSIIMTETVANVGFLVSYGPIASAATGSMFVPAGVVMPISGYAGSNLSVIRDAADGSASLTRALTY